MTILATAVVLGVLIVVHELGHFWAAKVVGIEVQRFSIGLGPRIFGFTRGETEYVLSAIPLGGYVKMGGMDDEAMEKLEGGEGPGEGRVPSDRDYDAKPIWARTFVISAGVIMNMLFAFGTYTFLAARYGIQELDTTRIGFVELGGLPPGTEALGTVEPGSRIIRMGDVATEDWGDVQDGLFLSAPGPLRIDMVEPTRTVEVRIPVTEDERRGLALAVEVWREAGVGFTTPGSPASDAGLQEGDRVVAVDGEATLNWSFFVQQIEARPGERVALTLVRDESEISRNITLDAEEVERPDGSTTEVGKIGISPPLISTTHRRVSFGQALEAGYRETAAVTGLILGFLRDLVTGNISARSIGSIGTIAEASGQAAAMGIEVFLRFMALFSINLAVLNMLPIPVLDGGHLVFLAIEAIRGGRPLSVEQRMKWTNAGFVMILGIMIWALGNDVMRWLGL